MRRLLAVVLLLGALVGSPCTARAAPCAVLQLGDLDLAHAQALLPQFAADQACGFLLDHRTHGQDDILNGGAPVTEGTNYPAYRTAVAALPPAQNYVRLNWDVYAPSNPAGQQYRFDIFSSTELQAYAHSWYNQASFARATGLTGIWLDAEPYDYRYAWDEEADTTMPASTKQGVTQQYELLGRIAAGEVLAAYPAIHMVLMPGFAFTVSAYVHYPDWYAGFLSVFQQAQRSVVIATESTSGVDSVTQPTLLSYLVGYEMGTQGNSGTYSPVRAVLQAYDAAHGTSLWSYHLATTRVSIELWPYRDATNNPDAAAPDLRLTLEDFGVTLRQAESLSPLVSIYSEQQASWEQPKYDCYANWTSSTPPSDTATYPLLYSGSQPCPGWVMSQ